MVTINETRLKASWTKYDAVKVIEMFSDGKLKSDLEKQEGIDKPVLKAFLGINSLTDPLPSHWEEIKKHPKQLRQFAFVAALTTHIGVVKKFAEKYSIQGQMGGTMIMEPGKEYTNIRSALVVSGAALENYRREHKVPFNFYALFENGEIGKLTRSLLTERLSRIGYRIDELADTTKFITLCLKHEFVNAIGLNKQQFKKWIEGTALSKEDCFTLEQLKIYKEIPMLEVHQWMSDWDDVRFDDELRRKPKPSFYLLSIDARLLKRISDVHRRTPKIDSKNVQRKASEDRISEIRNYIEGGFPWSTLSKAEQKDEDNSRLKMPGLLPTAIIANIIPAGTELNRKILSEQDEIRIIEEDSHGKKLPFPKLVIPEHIFDKNDWVPSIKPLEIIDGQHRLWAFNENQTLSGNYELPVVLFNNLDRAWQAYLFYMINIKPVKINTSLGFDLYPLLRTQEWLEGPKNELLAYREAMAQEIVEVLWYFEASPWRNRINMLGEAGGDTMTQAAFIRALVNSFFKRKKGFFNDTVKSNQLIEWNRAQQAAFFVIFWQNIEKAVRNCLYDWATMIRKEEPIQSSLFEQHNLLDKAFVGKNSFLSRDQGVRPLLIFANDFFFTANIYQEIDFNAIPWDGELDEKSITRENIVKAISLFNENKLLVDLLEKFAEEVAKVDWRTPSARFNSDAERVNQMKYRGSGGYKEFWEDIHAQFLKSNDKLVRKYASQIQK